MMACVHSMVLGVWCFALSPGDPGMWEIYLFGGIVMAVPGWTDGRAGVAGWLTKRGLNASDLV